MTPLFNLEAGRLLCCTLLAGCRLDAFTPEKMIKTGDTSILTN